MIELSNAIAAASSFTGGTFFCLAYAGLSKALIADFPIQHFRFQHTINPSKTLPDL